MSVYDQQKLLEELRELKLRLEEANDTIDAIKGGQVDALIINGEQGSQLYTLKSADQTYRIFIEKMSEGAVALNQEGTIIYSNSSFSRKIGIPLEKIIGVSFADFVESEDQHVYDNLFSIAWEQEIQAELFLKHSKDHKIPFLLSFSSLEIEEGISLSIILTDLTNRKENARLLRQKNEQLEEARDRLVNLNYALEDAVTERTEELELSREYFKLLANTMPQMCWTNNTEGEVDFYNQRWYEYTGLTFDETRSWGWKAVVHPDDLKKTMAAYASSLSSGEMFVVENRYKNSAGVYRWHLNRSLPVRGESGEIALWVGTATDIDDQRKAMEKKDEFIGIASHELKTPLTSLKGYLQLIAAYKKQELPPIIKQFIARANESGNKLQNLVNDLLDVSKIQAGKLEFQSENIQCWELLTNCGDNAKLIYPEFNFTLNCPDNFTVYGNSERLEQVIMNFISNAVKYSSEDKRIILSVHKKKDDVYFSVQDFGIGLSETEKKLVFERFYRVEDKKFQTSGLGMGLFISNEIIKAHSGKIGVESKFGEGSTFYFSLPDTAANL